jgi:hypothetical protein
MGMTARDIITHAMKECKILPAGGVPEASEIADGLFSLQGMLRSWQPYANLWRRGSATMFINADTSTAQLPAYVRTVSAARLVEGTTERLIAVWDEERFDMLPNKAARGTIIAVSMSRQVDGVSLSFWPIPRTDATLKVEYQRTFDALTNETDTIDIPEDWLEAVWTNLAVRIHGMYQDTAALSPELVSRASTLLRELRDDDRPDAYFMGGYCDYA